MDETNYPKVTDLTAYRKNRSAVRVISYPDLLEFIGAPALDGPILANIEELDREIRRLEVEGAPQAEIEKLEREVQEWFNQLSGPTQDKLEAIVNLAKGAPKIDEDSDPPNPPTEAEKQHE